MSIVILSVFFTKDKTKNRITMGSHYSVVLLSALMLLTGRDKTKNFFFGIRFVEGRMEEGNKTGDFTGVTMLQQLTQHALVLMIM